MTTPHITHSDLLQAIRLLGFDPSDLPAESTISLDQGIIRATVFARGEDGRHIINMDANVVERTIAVVIVDEPEVPDTVAVPVDAKAILDALLRFKKSRGGGSLGL